MYHAACKVVFQPFKRLYSQLTFFNFLYKKILSGWKTCTRYQVIKHYFIINRNRRTPQPVAFGPLFPTANNFSWVGIGLILETDFKKPNPTKFSANTPIRVCTGTKQICGKKPVQLPRHIPGTYVQASCESHTYNSSPHILNGYSSDYIVNSIRSIINSSGR